MVTSLKLEYVELKSWGSLLTNGKKGNSDVKNIVEEEEEEEEVIYFAVLYAVILYQDILSHLKVAILLN